MLWAARVAGRTPLHPAPSQHSLGAGRAVPRGEDRTGADRVLTRDHRERVADLDHLTAGQLVGTGRALGISIGRWSLASWRCAGASWMQVPPLLSTLHDSPCAAVPVVGSSGLSVSSGEPTPWRVVQMPHAFEPRVGLLLFRPLVILTRQAAGYAAVPRSGRYRTWDQGQMLGGRRHAGLQDRLRTALPARSRS